MATDHDPHGPAFDHFFAANEHGFYCVPTAYRGREVPDVLWRGDIYEPATLAFLTRHCRDGDVVSGGAFVGDFLPALSRSVRPGRLVHSFEPAPLSYESALATIALNRIDNVVLHPVAVGAADDTLPLQVSRRDGTAVLAAGARLVSGARHPGTVDVAVRRLDDIVPTDRNVTLVHLDIEGHELPALAGAIGLLTRCRPILVIEAGRRRRRRELLEFLAEMVPDAGYVATSTIENNCIFLATGA